MSNPAIAWTSPPQYALTHAYLTTDEWRNAPTAVDSSDLIIGGSDLSEDQQLEAVIFRASSWIDLYCGQTLFASTDTEMGRPYINRRGELIIHPANWPVLAVTDVQMGPVPSQLNEVDLTNAWVDRQLVTIPSGTVAQMTSAGPLQFGGFPYGAKVFARWTYINGYPVTTLATLAVGGASTIQVTDITGIYAGTGLQIVDDDAGNESVIVAATPSTTTLTLAATLNANHAAGLPVTSLPPAVKQAAILLTSALIRSRGNEALVMNSVSGGPTRTRSSTSNFDVNVEIAKELLDPFKAVR